MLYFCLLVIVCGVAYGHKTDGGGDVTLSDIYTKLNVLTRMTDMALQACANHANRPVALPKAKQANTESTTTYSSKAVPIVGSQRDKDTTTSKQATLQFITSRPAAATTIQPHKVVTSHSAKKSRLRNYVRRHGKGSRVQKQVVFASKNYIYAFCLHTHQLKRVTRVTKKLDVIRIDHTTKIMYGATFESGCIGEVDRNRWINIRCGLFRGKRFAMAVANDVVVAMETHPTHDPLQLSTKTHRVISSRKILAKFPIKGEIIYVSLDASGKEMSVFVVEQKKRTMCLVMTTDGKLREVQLLHPRPVLAITYDFFTHEYLCADESAVFKTRMPFKKKKKLVRLHRLSTQINCLAAAEDGIYLFASKKIMVMNKATGSVIMMKHVSPSQTPEPGVCAA